MGLFILFEPICSEVGSVLKIHLARGSCCSEFVFNFIWFWLCWVFVAAHGLSLVAASGGCSVLRSTGCTRAGFSSCGSRALEHRLSSCGARASLLRGMWDLPGPGLKPVSPALAGRFLSTVPPGKSPGQNF